MTGEVTLTGRVLPVGGVREKILAARRAGIKSVLIPRHNEKDLVEIPAEVKADLTLQLVDTLDDVVPRLFPKDSRKSTSRPRPSKKPAPRQTGPRQSGQPEPTRKPPSSTPSRPRLAGFALMRIDRLHWSDDQ